MKSKIKEVIRSRPKLRPKTSGKAKKEKPEGKKIKKTTAVYSPSEKVLENRKLHY